MTTNDDLCFLSIAELGSLMRARTISPVEVTDAHLARIERLDPTLNAFVTVMAADAREAARRAEAELAAGQWRGPLHGVPIGVKDIFDTAGVRTTQGSAFYRDNIPAQDAESIRRLKDAGAVLIGKCNTHEFAAGSTTNNPWYGATRNPWALDRSPGGSSGGSGAAVAAFLCPGATGTDTGGSIRGPAACCGIVGLKPTYGRVSLRGIYPNALSLDHAGPLTRTARDAGLLLAGMAGYDRHDPTSADVPVPDFTADIDAGVSGLRLARCPDLHFLELDVAVARGLDDAAAVFGGLGAKVETMPFALAADVQPTREALSRGEFLALHRERFAAHPEGYGADVRARLAEGDRITVDAYVRACRMREALRREFDEMLRVADAIILPVAPCEAPLIATGVSRVNGHDVTFSSGLAMRQIVNVVGLPSVAVPIGFGETGLPLSMQIVGPAWGEAHVLRIAHAYEVATPHIRRRRPSFPAAT
ncbi:MAG: amidase [Candidatus Rokubacteria bacterium]|nr:amidase [Candidatus Rokubacteria bacterium]